MTEEERKHRQLMLDFAKKEAEKDRPLTPQELAEAIKAIKEKYPKDLPSTKK